MKFTLSKTFSILPIALCTITASAADDGSTFRFDGFGTLGLTHSSEPNADFAPDPARYSGAGYSKNWSPVDSKIGGQVSANYKNWSAVLQVVSEQNVEGNYRPHVEWANVKYDFTSDASVRFGRVTLPTNLYSEVRKVGYSIPWARTTTFFYNLIPVTSTTGLNASYSFHIGDVKNTITGLAALHDSSINTFKLNNIGNHIEVENQVNSANSLNDKIEWHDLTMQFSYFKGAATIPTVMAIVPVPSLAKLFDHAAYTYKEVGFSYDPGKYFLIAELAEDKAPFLGSRRGWYVSGGYRIGNFTPYVLYEDIKQLDPSPVISSTALTSASVGVRWDVKKNIALKAQYDKLRLEPGATGPLINVQQPSFGSGKHDVGIATFTVDFVF